MAAENAAPQNAAAEKEDNLTYCLAHLAAFDIAPLHPKADLTSLTRDNVQLLVNKVFSLKREETDEGPTVEMPIEEGFRIPRQRPIPKVKPETRWEAFMKERRMEKRKRSSMVFDEASGDWKRRFGYKSSKSGQDAADGIMEVKTGHDSYANPFDKKKAEHKLIQAKQKMREVRNRVEAAGGRLKAAAPDLAFMASGGSATKRGAAGLKEALKRSQTSSASFGKFDRVAPGEPTNLQQKKRKVGGLPGNLADERSRYMKFAEKTLSGQGGVDKDKAAGAARHHETEHIKRKTKAPKRRSKQGGGRKSGGKKS